MSPLLPPLPLPLGPRLPAPTLTPPVQGNKLGTAFIEATERVRAQAWHDLFDTCIFEIKQEGEGRPPHGLAVKPTGRHSRGGLPCLATASTWVWE